MVSAIIRTSKALPRSTEKSTLELGGDERLIILVAGENPYAG